MDLILWRHADALEPEAGQHDVDRELSTKGERQAARMAKWLDRQLPEGTRVITPDIAGNGARFREASHMSVPAMAEDLRQQLRAQGVTGPCRVLAMSQGEVLAMGTPAEVQSHPGVIEAYLGTIDDVSSLRRDHAKEQHP